MSGSNGDIFDQARLPAAATAEEREYRREKQLKAATYMVKNGPQGFPDLVQMLGLDEVFSKPEHHDGLQRLIAQMGGAP